MALKSGSMIWVLDCKQSEVVVLRSTGQILFISLICKVTRKVKHPGKPVFNKIVRWFSSSQGFSLLSWFQCRDMWAKQKLVSEERFYHCSVWYPASHHEAVRCWPGPSADWQVTHTPAGCWRFWQHRTEPSANCGRLSSFVISQVASVCLRLNVCLVS